MILGMAIITVVFGQTHFGVGEWRNWSLCQYKAARHWMSSDSGKEMGCGRSLVQQCCASLKDSQDSC